MPSTVPQTPLFLALLALPYALFSMAWLPSIGIRATLAAIGLL